MNQFGVTQKEAIETMLKIVKIPLPSHLEYWLRMSQGTWWERLRFKIWRRHQ